MYIMDLKKNTETWTILSIEEIREKIDTNQGILYRAIAWTLQLSLRGLIDFPLRPSGERKKECLWSST